MAIIDKDDIKIFLGIIDTGSDALLDVLAIRSCAMIESFCNRKFEKDSFAERFCGDGSSKFYAQNLPLEFGATEKIEIEDEDDILEADVHAFVDSGIIKLKNRVLTLDSLCTVTYKGGFETVPEDVKHATVEIAALLFNRNKSTGIKSESDGPVSVTYDDSGISELPAVSAVIEFYRIPNFE